MMKTASLKEGGVFKTNDELNRQMRGHVEPESPTAGRVVDIW